MEPTFVANSMTDRLTVLIPMSSIFIIIIIILHKRRMVK